jgi:SAM-dependent methyltransferase
MHRVGSLEGVGDPTIKYQRMGQAQARMLHDLLPPDWSWDGKRALDFGSGAGKTLRHLTSEAEVAEIWGCDIDVPSIEWASRHLTPPFHFALSADEPPLAFEAQSFDLVYAFSVFTHLVETSSAWLLELHRILQPAGFLIVSFLGQAYTREYAGEPYDDARIGRNFLRCGQSWDLGGPSVLMSPWWIRAHWGRAFDFLDLRDIPEGQGVAVMKKRAVTMTVQDVDRPEPGEPRELTAAFASAQQLARELGALRASAAGGAPETSELERLRSELEAARAEAARLSASLEGVYSSRSWRLTAPLRRARQPRL